MIHNIHLESKERVFYDWGGSSVWNDLTGKKTSSYE